MRLDRILTACLAAACLSAGHAEAQLLTFIQKALPTQRTLAEATPDQCYDLATGTHSAIMGGVCAMGDPKFNHTYPWSLAQTQFSGAPRYWIGTGANVHCLTFALLFGVTGAQETDSWVCDGLLADTRVPQAFRYDVATSTLVSLEPEFQKAGAVATIARGVRALSRGYRAAGANNLGAANGVVLLAGPGLLSTTFFAFDENGILIGSHLNTNFTNVRSMLTLNGQIYIGVQRSNGTGAVLRWRGTKASPFPITGGGPFEVVANLDAEAANLALYKNNRIAVTTWPAPLQTNARAGLYISPASIAPATANQWTKVWSVDQYESNPDVARVLKGGALAFHDNYLVWGTMVDPGAALVSTLAAELENGNNIITPNAILTAFYSTWRATAVFRGKDLETATPKIELLYGERKLPVYDHVTDVWSLQNNASSYSPRWGEEGFGNAYNNHTWAAQVVSGKLYLGTMDSRQVLDESLGALINAALASPEANPPPPMEGSSPVFTYPTITQQDITSFVAPILLGNFGLIGDSLDLLLNGNPEGGDIWRFELQNSNAKAEDLSGLGNPNAYGFRNFVVSGDKLIVGAASVANIEPSGGFEVLELGPGRRGLLPF